MKKHKISLRVGRLCCLILGFLLVLGVATIVHAQSATCGNGVLEIPEECDDGNLAGGDGCSSTCLIEEDCFDIGNTFSFFTCSDTYPGQETGIARTWLDAINSQRYPQRVIPRFWISPGDIPLMTLGFSYLDEGNDEILGNSVWGNNYPFDCSASNGKFPYFVAVGNHDIDPVEEMSAQTKYDYWSNYEGPKYPGTLVGITNFRWGPAAAHEIRTTYSFDYKNAHFVVVNQYHGDANYPNGEPLACIRADLHDWVDQDLAATDKPIKFVFGHEPAWSYCSNLEGKGGSSCPSGSIDNQDPPYRQRPYSTTGAWTEAFGRHWHDSLESYDCPEGSRDRFWNMIASHNVVAHYVGHTHTYSSRLVEADGTRRNDVSAYNKTGEEYYTNEGVWEVNTGSVHTSAGCVYVLTTIRDNVVTFEAYDQIGTSEPFKLIEKWNVRVGLIPTVSITAPADGAVLTAPLNLTLGAEAFEQGGQVADVAFYANGALIGTDAVIPYSLVWSDVQPGVYSLTATATDSLGNRGTSSPVAITVVSATGNHPPSFEDIQSRTVAEGSVLEEQISATDPDGDNLTFNLVNPPTGATIEASSGILRWVPDELQGPGVQNITVRVTDNGTPPLNASTSFSITVDEVNQAPVLADIGTKAVTLGSTLTFTALATDLDRPSNPLRFSLVNAPSGASINATSGAFSWKPVQIGTYNFNITVTDNGSPSLSDSKPVIVSVGTPDLTITGVQPAASSVRRGARLAVTHTVLNAGSVGAGSSVVGFRLSKNTVYGDSDDRTISTTQSITPLPAGASLKKTTNITIPTTTPVGSYFICAMADRNNAIIESNESNNVLCSSSPITVNR
jgi:cysteine-rich repeat protein